MTGLDPDGVVESVRVAVREAQTSGVPCPAEYEITDTSRRAVSFILSTVRRHHEWNGIRRAGVAR